MLIVNRLEYQRFLRDPVLSNCRAFSNFQNLWSFSSSSQCLEPNLRSEKLQEVHNDTRKKPVWLRKRPAASEEAVLASEEAFLRSRFGFGRSCLLRKNSSECHYGPPRVFCFLKFGPKLAGAAAGRSARRSVRLPQPWPIEI